VKGSIPVLLLAAQLPAQIDVERLVANLGSEPNAEVRLSAYRQLRSLKSPAALRLVVESLATWKHHAQTLGTQLIVQYPIKLRLPALRSIVHAKGPFLSFSGAVGLWRAGERDYAAEIATALRSRDATNLERTSMVMELPLVRDPAVEQAMRGLIEPGMHVDLLDAVLYHMIRKRDTKATAAVSAVLRDARTPILGRGLCAAFLVATGASDHSRALAEVLATGQVPFLRMKRYLQRAPHLDNTVIVGLIECVDKETLPRGIAAALRLLGSAGGSRGAPTLRKFLGHDDELVVMTALNALSRLAGGVTNKQLIQLLASDKPTIVIKAADMLRRRDDFSGMSRLLELAKDGPKKADAVHVLRGFRKAAVVEPLIDALLDPAQPVRVQAYYSLGIVLGSLFPYKRISLVSTGLNVAGPAAPRQRAVATIRRWWSAQLAKAAKQKSP
jgi:hypothetical protein